MTERLDCVVIGAGAIGLAVARRLALAGRDTVILEAAETIGNEISSRNSEVIHAGIYYPSGSLKAELCVAGRELLYEYCDRHGVPHKKLGKIIVATNDREVAGLDALAVKAAANGVRDLVRLERRQVLAMEPALRCAAALLSPSTGIVDSHSLLLALLGDAEDQGAAIAYRTPFRSAAPTGNGLRFMTGGAEPLTADCTILVNAAGLDAPDVSRRIVGVEPQSIPPAYFAKGSYFILAGRTPFSRLIYPMPEPGGLGVHVTLDMAGRARFGPDVEWVAERNYAVDSRRAGKFYDAIRRYWPGLPDGALAPGYAGIRPKINGPNEPAADFAVHGPADTGVPGYAALYGIESPGLTAAFAIADLVARKLGIA